jgi:hypothetical protein
VVANLEEACFSVGRFVTEFSLPAVVTFDGRGNVAED